MNNRAQTNIDFAFAGLAITIFLSATLLIPSSPLFSFTNTEIDNQIEAEEELVRIEKELLESGGGEISTQNVCSFTSSGNTITQDNIKTNVSFTSLGDNSKAGLSTNTIDSCNTSTGPPIADTVVTQANKTIIVNGELTQITISMWRKTS